MSELERIVAKVLADNYSNRWRPHALADGLVEALQAAGVAVVGRCGDCKRHLTGNDWYVCEICLELGADDNGFCSDFEPKEADE